MPTSIQSKQKILELKKNKGYQPSVEEVITYEGLKKLTLEGKKFKFDRVFKHTEDQNAIFDEVEEVVQSFLDGYNVCIFAYG